MKKFMAIIFVFLVSCSVLADPAPFGLELGKATEKDLINKFSASLIGLNLYSKGNMYKVPTSELELRGLKSAIFIFDDNKKLAAVLLNLPKHRFDSLMNSLASKYHLKNKTIPFVGTKEAVFTDGDTEITMLAEHLSFDMSLNYLTNTFYRNVKKQRVKKRQEEKNKESSAL